MAKGLNETEARELVENAVRSLAGKAAAAKAKPALEAVFELARQSSKAAGKRALAIRSITVQTVGADEGDTSSVTVYDHVPVDAGPSRTPTDAGPKKRIPVAYGGTGHACFLVATGPPPTYFCIYW